MMTASPTKLKRVGESVPILFLPPPKKRSKQLALETAWAKEREKPNELINQVRQRVAEWRIGEYQGVTATTRQLLQYWTNRDRERRLFFCQIEALETLIYLTEVADTYGQQWIRQELRQQNEYANPGLFRLAVKMATGSGKTVVLAMVIAWQVLNKLVSPQDRRFSDAFLIISPGITIRDRLRVLFPNDPHNYYVERDIVRSAELERLQQARLVITNFQAFALREKPEFAVASLTKKVLAGPDGDLSRFKETPDEMVRRVCRALGTKKQIMVLNDEAHHCYREKPQAQEEKLAADEREEVRQNREAARIWVSGLEAVAEKIGIRSIIDVSATPFFLRGSGYSEGTLFPWVVSDFSLIDAIESGIVKIPRVPVSDNQMSGALPTYRDLWLRIRDRLPRKSAKTLSDSAEPRLPSALETAILSLYNNYEKYYSEWENGGRIGMPPVFIVVCNNTSVSKLVYDFIAGWEKKLPDGSIVVPGRLPIFNNERDGTWRDLPNSLLIDSTQIDRGTAMDDAFKQAARAEIEEFKADMRKRFPERNADEITDEDMLREVLNTVGKAGRLGESVKCVVSVSMLTEGWDANTVTHILGIRAFGTQLLCEQVVGRGLRRMTYDVNAQGLLEPEYAEVYGVPFSFLPVAGTRVGPKSPKPVHRVVALPERQNLEITFPRVVGYRYELPMERLEATFNDDSTLTLTTEMTPTRTVLDPIVGESTETNIDALRKMRAQHIAFVLAKRVLDTYFPGKVSTERPWLFPQTVAIAKRWMAERLVCKDNTFLQMLLIADYGRAAADRIYRSIVRGTVGEKRLVARLLDYAQLGSTRNVAFDTTKGVYATQKSHLNYVVLDSDWEAKAADSLEAMDEVIAYVKNDDRVGLRIPYSVSGQERAYIPDFFLRWQSGDEELHVVLEVTGQRRSEKAEKIATVRDLWVPAVNNLGEFGRWIFVEITDPNETQALLRSSLAGASQVSA